MTDNKTREEIQAEVQAAARKQTRNELLKRIARWGVAVLVLVGLVWGLAILASNSPTANDGELADVVNASDWKRGSTAPKAELVEYSDFQCPYCRIYKSYVDTIMQKYGDKVQLVYRNYPLVQAHEHADLAARAAEAAGIQGKFWEMHDILFDKQTDWEHATNAQDIMVAYATSLGLDTAKFKDDINSNVVRDNVAQDIASGNRANVQATPTFYLNGKKLNLTAYGDLEPAVAKALE